MRLIGITPILVAVLAACRAIAADGPPHLDLSGVNLQPSYPSTALKNSERGAAVIGVNVNQAGRVNFAYPLKTSGFDDLDSAAIMGVMGWRFVPATKNGTAVDGDAAVEIIFQPPDAPNGATQPTADTPQPKGDFFPKSLEIEAKRGWYHNEDYPALCPNGTLRSTIQFLRPHGPAAAEWAPAASLIVKAGKDDAVVLQMLGREMITPPQEVFVMKQQRGGDAGALAFSHSMELDRQETVSLSWDSTGLVTGTVGGMETHQERMNEPPSQLELGISSGAARFLDSVLLCKAAGQM